MLPRVVTCSALFIFTSIRQLYCRCIFMLCVFYQCGEGVGACEAVGTIQFFFVFHIAQISPARHSTADSHLFPTLRFRL